MLVTELQIDIDFLKIKNEVFSLIKKHEDRLQLCLQGKEKTYFDLLEGTGKKTDDEKLYIHTHPLIHNTEIEKIIIKFNAVRTRIMRMLSRSCYSVHKDTSKRIHIPIKTDDQAWMVWPYHKQCVNLKQEKIYLTDTTKSHSFFNGSSEERIHLVLCIYDETYLNLNN